MVYLLNLSTKGTLFMMNFTSSSFQHTNISIDKDHLLETAFAVRAGRVKWPGGRRRLDNCWILHMWQLIVCKNSSFFERVFGENEVRILMSWKFFVSTMSVLQVKSIWTVVRFSLRSFMWCAGYHTWMTASCNRMNVLDGYFDRTKLERSNI